MPLYEYECDDCGGRFERIQKFSDPLEEICPTCGGVVRKLLSSPAIQFKGTGWYVTDYAKQPNAGQGDGERAEATAEKDTKSKPSSPSSESSSKDTKSSSNSKEPSSKSSSTSDGSK